MGRLSCEKKIVRLHLYLLVFKRVNGTLIEIRKILRSFDVVDVEGIFPLGDECRTSGHSKNKSYLQDRSEINVFFPSVEYGSLFLKERWKRSLWVLLRTRLINDKQRGEMLLWVNMRFRSAMISLSCSEFIHFYKWMLQICGESVTWGWIVAVCINRTE